jgi:hypothetical protein
MIRHPYNHAPQKYWLRLPHWSWPNSRKKVVLEIKHKLNTQEIKMGGK